MDTKSAFFQQCTEVTEIFTEVARMQAEAGARLDLSCLPGCGKCCNNPQIEISPLEAYPWVLAIIEKGETDKYLDLLAANFDDLCIFYQHDPLNKDQGYCGNYAYRPLMCRLFGCSVLPDKEDHLRPVLCKVLKNARPNLAHDLKQELANDLKLPAFNVFYTRLATIDPYWGNVRQPINQAFFTSLQKISYLNELIKQG